MSGFTINLPDPTADKLRAYLAGKGQDVSAFVVEAIEETLANRAAWDEHLAQLDKSYEDALAGRGKNVDEAFADIRARIEREIEL